MYIVEEVKSGGRARWVEVRDGSRGAEEPGKAGVAPTASLNGLRRSEKAYVRRKFSRHIDIRRYFVRDMVSAGVLKLVPLHAHLMVADALTKSLIPPPTRRRKERASLCLFLFPLWCFPVVTGGVYCVHSTSF
jgi:hypothetical protein